VSVPRVYPYFWKLLLLKKLAIRQRGAYSGVRVGAFFGGRRLIPPMKIASLPECLCSLFLAFVLSTRAAVPVSSGGNAVMAVLESMGVDRLWLAGAIVDWRTGEPTGKPIADKGKHTHCSQFAAAAYERLGVYILRPPEHSAVQLANAQFEWLQDEGGCAGWAPLPNGVSAQDSANIGMVVVAVCKNPDPKKPGHIALVRAGQKSEELIAKEGPDVIQAGGTNFVRTSLRRGFANHPESYDAIRFFTHAPDLNQK